MGSKKGLSIVKGGRTAMVSRNPQLSPRCVLTAHCLLLLHRAFGDSNQKVEHGVQAIYRNTRPFWHPLAPGEVSIAKPSKIPGPKLEPPFAVHCPLPGPGPLVSLLAFHSCVGQGISDLHLPSLAVGLPSGAAGRQWTFSLHTVSCVSLTKSS